MYHSLATGGLRQPLRAIRSVTDRHGRSLARYSERSTRVAGGDAVFLVTHALRGVLSEGTGRRARKLLARGQVLAGKTGTTDGLRDSWFAGYGANRVAVVWVGRDDNRPVNLSGSSGALEVWARLMRAIGEASVSDVAPRGVVWHWVSRDAGRRIERECSGAVRLPFVDGTPPARRTVRIADRRTWRVPQLPDRVQTRTERACSIFRECRRSTGTPSMTGGCSAMSVPEPASCGKASGGCASCALARAAKSCRPPMGGRADSASIRSRRSRSTTFSPGTPVLSFGTAGCNLACKFCQNWDMSKSRQMDTLADAASPEDLARASVRFGCRSIAFTYNDPIIFLEYAIDVARACHARGVRPVAVTAGYVCDGPTP